MTLTWVVGAGGLLGKNLEATARGRHTTYSGPRIPWHDGPRTRATLGEAVEGFRAAAGGGDWQVLWAAGAGVTGTSAETFTAELSVLRDFLGLLGRSMPTQNGAVFLASSCGGVYGGVQDPPYDEHSPVKPLGDYGAAKLAAEQVVRDFSLETGVVSLVGRISNLYGPGQNIAKPQGLISQICRSHLTGQPAHIWVSLDTLRDYLYAPDCGQMVVDAMDHLRTLRVEGVAEPVTVKVFAAQRAVSIAEILGEMKRVLRQPPKVILASSPAAVQQARDLTVRSVVWPHIDERTFATLPSGISATLADLRRGMQAGAPQLVAGSL